MKRAIVGCSLLSLLTAVLANYQVASAAPSRSQLVGVWVLIESDTSFPAACASGLPITYLATGTYNLFEETGTWKLEGSKLTETATELFEPSEEDEDTVGQPFVSTIEWQGRNALLKTFADGSTYVMRRCIKGKDFFVR